MLYLLPTHLMVTNKSFYIVCVCAKTCKCACSLEHNLIMGSYVFYAKHMGNAMCILNTTINMLIIITIFSNNKLQNSLHSIMNIIRIVFI